MSRRHDQMSPRPLRVGESLRHEIAGMLMRGEVHDPRLEGLNVTVSEVRVSPDLRNATVFVAELGREASNETLALLNHAGPFMAGKAARALHLKYAPHLHFARDESFAEAQRIETLIARARKDHPHG
ncbi:MAG: 30S ribosome-binding factor RbfA [Geminicoccaceae bacterium]